jgi:hypothetical protein
LKGNNMTEAHAGHGAAAGQGAGDFSVTSGLRHFGEGANDIASSTIRGVTNVVTAPVDSVEDKVGVGAGIALAVLLGPAGLFAGWAIGRANKFKTQMIGGGGGGGGGHAPRPGAGHHIG